ncbi:hypothetical protein C8J57DRAFT_1680452 [Mycena rebaudengoi]|nr:hypothetical protein C8J57DRAFT_1680452 [Mycena rebaudengoi]
MRMCAWAWAWTWLYVRVRVSGGVVDSSRMSARWRPRLIGRARGWVDGVEDGPDVDDDNDSQLTGMWTPPPQISRGRVNAVGHTALPAQPPAAHRARVAPAGRGLPAVSVFEFVSACELKFTLCEYVEFAARDRGDVAPLADVGESAPAAAATTTTTTAATPREPSTRTEPAAPAGAKTSADALADGAGAAVGGAAAAVAAYGYEGEGDRGITMRGGGHGRKSSAYMALAALARRAGGWSASTYSGNNTSTAYPYRPATPGSTPPLSADLVEDDSGASASEGEYQEFRGPSGGMGRRRAGKLLTPPATPPRDGEGVVGVVHDGYTDEHEQHQADDEHADDEQHPPRPLFNARKASAQCRRLEGYVSFAAVEGLGEPPSPAPSSASTSTSDEEEDGKGGETEEEGQYWGGAGGALEGGFCGEAVDVARTGLDGGQRGRMMEAEETGRVRRVDVDTPVETRRQDRRRRTMSRRTPPRDGVKRWRRSWTAEQAPRVDCNTAWTGKVDPPTNCGIDESRHAGVFLLPSAAQSFPLVVDDGESKSSRAPLSQTRLPSSIHRPRLPGARALQSTLGAAAVESRVFPLVNICPLGRLVVIVVVIGTPSLLPP